MIVKGKLITCKREVKIFGGKEQKEKLYITLAEVKLDKKKLEEAAAAFAESGKKFTPDWVKDFKGYVNLATEFPLPARQKLKDEFDTETDSIEKLIKAGFPFIGAEVEVSLNIKEGAIYPNALVFRSEGKPFNPFAEFDNMEED